LSNWPGATLRNGKATPLFNTANTQLVMGAGGAAAIAQRAGATAQREALEKAPINTGEATRPRAGLLTAKFVIRAAVMEPDLKTDAAIVARAAALADAEAIGLKSIAFPALGTGVGALPYDVAARALFDAVAAYIQTRPVARFK
jgi:O-acetyl-ADP-ribose deacetylase (regulator of RNase III)